MRFGPLDVLNWIEPCIAVLTIAISVASGQAKKFQSLVGLLSVRAFASFALILLSLAPVSSKVYPYYFYVYWVGYTVGTLLGFGVVYSVFSQAMAPLKGLHSLGGMMFRWALCISLMVSITMGLGAHGGGGFLLRSILQLEQAESVLTLCMLLFVTLAIKPMGLSYGSKLFGVNLGLGVLAAADLVFTALASHSDLFHGSIPLINEVTVCMALGIWTVYFALPEPKRRMILLPTTSPFLRWNQISMALGDEPGFVAVGEVTLDMFAPAELEVMRRASVKMAAKTGTGTLQPSPIVNRVLSSTRELAKTKQQRTSF